MLKKKRLAKYAVAAGLSSDELDEVILCMDVLVFAKGDSVIKEHTLTSALYILEEGRVSVQIEVSYEDHSRLEELATLEPGDVFGEMAFLDEWRRTAFVVALEDIVVLKLDGELLNGLFERNHHIGYIMMRNLGRILTRRLMDTNFFRKSAAEQASEKTCPER